MILSIGEILFDIFPNYKTMGGAPFNFAYHIKQLGYPVRFVSRIGNDDEGREITETIEKYGFEPEYLQDDNTFNTGKVLVKLDPKGTPEFKIVKDTAYDYIEFDNNLRSILNGHLDLIYFGTLIQRSASGFTTIHQVLEGKKVHTKSLYDVNLRPDCYSTLTVIESLKHTNILKLNDDELGLLKKMFGYKNTDEAFIHFLFNEFPIELTALTKGEKGSELFTKNDHAVQPAGSLKSVVDTVGAGDGFAAMLAIGYLQKWEPAKILSIATSFAEKICRNEGAISTDSAFYDEFGKMINNKG